MRIAILILLLQLTISCATSEDTFQKELRKADVKSNKVLSSLSYNSQFQQTTDKEFLSLFSEMGCPKNARLKVKEGVFEINNPSDRVCVKKWADMFINSLNEKYNFFSIGNDYSVELITDVSKLENINFDTLETNTRTKFRNTLKKSINEVRGQAIAAEERRQRENEERRANAIREGTRQISEGFSKQYAAPEPVLQIDQTCFQRCQDGGYQYDFCKKRCEF